MLQRLPVLFLVLLVIFVSAVSPSTAQQPTAETASLVIKVMTTEGGDVQVPLRVYLVRATDNRQSIESSTAAEGNAYTFTGLAPDQYTAKLFLNWSNLLAQKDITLKPGGNTLDWTIPAIATATFHFTYPDGTDVTDDSLSVTITRLTVPLAGPNHLRSMAAGG
jgi:hypothetical protein